jgi:hypothetical protein
LKIEVTIRRGQVKMDVIGGQGPDCEHATKPYEELLAAGGVTRTRKPEYAAGDAKEAHRIRENQ